MSPLKTLMTAGIAAAALALPAQAATVQTAEGPDIVDIAVSAGSFDTLVAAVQAAGLVDVLKSDGPFTVFAPTDEAFAKLPAGTVADLLKPENKDQLVAILTYHVVPGKVTARDALAARSAATVEGQSVEIGIAKGALSVNDSKVLDNDIEASNGIIHVIDAVLIPPQLPASGAPGVVGFYPGDVSNADRKALRLANGQGAAITGLVDGSDAGPAGLREGDVILLVNGKPYSTEMLGEAKAKAGIGGQVEVTIARKVKVTITPDH